MTEIPPGLPASAAQAGIQAGEVSKEREVRRGNQAEAARRQIQSVDEAGSTVDTEDADVAIFADAEGSGSEGREEEGAEPSQGSEEGGDHTGEGMSRDDQGRLHIDLEA